MSTPWTEEETQQLATMLLSITGGYIKPAPPWKALEAAKFYPACARCGICGARWVQKQASRRRPWDELSLELHLASVHNTGYYAFMLGFIKAAIKDMP